MLSRLTASIAERIRNLNANVASESTWRSIAETLKRNGPFSPADRVPLECQNGQVIEVSRLALGTGTDGWMGASSQTRKLGVKGLSDLFLYGFHEYGINFWDTADQYGSHPHVAEALKQVQREDVVILTKSVATTGDQMKRDLDRFRKELGTDYIDILLLHCMTRADWPKQMEAVMDVLSEACAEGVIRMRGVSCHTFPALETAATCPWVELDLARINPGGKSMDADPEEVIPVLKRMKASGKSVMAMKVLGKGKLASDIPACLMFALGLDFIDCMTIGCLNRQELDEIVEEIKNVIV